MLSPPSLNSPSVTNTDVYTHGYYAAAAAAASASASTAATTAAAAAGNGGGDDGLGGTGCSTHLQGPIPICE